MSTEQMKIAILHSDVRAVEKYLELGLTPDDYIDDAFAVLLRAPDDHEEAETLLCLLRHNSRPPVDFQYKVAPKKIKDFIDMNESVQKAYIKGSPDDFEFIDRILGENPKLTHFYDRNGQSLLARALKLNKPDEQLRCLASRLKVGPHESTPDALFKLLALGYELPKSKDDESFIEILMEKTTATKKEIFLRAYRIINAHPHGSVLLEFASKIVNLEIEVVDSVLNEERDSCIKIYIKEDFLGNEEYFVKLLKDKLEYAVHFFGFTQHQKSLQAKPVKPSSKRPGASKSSGTDESRKKRHRKNISGDITLSNSICEGSSVTFYDRKFIRCSMEIFEHPKSFCEISREPHKNLLVGEAGVGKSKILEMLANNDENISLIDLSHCENILQSFYNQMDDPVDADGMLFKLTSEGPAEKLFFDGFDLVDRRYHQVLLNFFTHLEKREIWIAVRSNSYAYLQSILDIRTYKLQNLSHPQKWLYTNAIFFRNESEGCYRDIERVMTFATDIRCADNLRALKLLTEILIENNNYLDRMSIYNSCLELINKLMEEDCENRNLWQALTYLALYSTIPEETFWQLSIPQNWNVMVQQHYKMIQKSGLVSFDRNCTRNSIRFTNPIIAEFVVIKYITESLSDESNLTDEEKNRIQQLFNSTLKNPFSKMKDLMKSYLIANEGRLSNRLNNIKNGMNLDLRGAVPNGSINALSPELWLTVGECSKFSDMNLLSLILSYRPFAKVFNRYTFKYPNFKVLVNADSLLMLLQYDKFLDLKNFVIDIHDKIVKEFLIDILLKFKGTISQLEITTNIFNFLELRRVLRELNSLGKLKMSNCDIDTLGRIDQHPSLYSVELNKCTASTFSIFHELELIKLFTINNENWLWNHPLQLEFNNLVGTLPRLNLVTYYDSPRVRSFIDLRGFNMPIADASYELKGCRYVMQLTRARTEGQKVERDEPMEIDNILPTSDPKILVIGPENIINQIDDEGTLNFIQDKIEDVNIQIKKIHIEDGLCVVELKNENDAARLKSLIEDQRVPLLPGYRLRSLGPKNIWIIRYTNIPASSMDRHIILSKIARFHNFEPCKIDAWALREIGNQEIEFVITPRSIDDRILQKKHHMGLEDDDSSPRRINLRW